MDHFSLKELATSETAKNAKINNVPSEKETANLVRLVDDVLDPLRKAYGKPIKVNSGYRNDQLNKLVKGAKNSHHVKGMAADITAGSKEENRKLFDLVQSLKLPFTQLIDEKNFSWVHVSFDKDDVKRQVLHL